jgi:4-alpha-glucanotransferase
VTSQRELTVAALALDARRALGIGRLVLSIHDVSFPSRRNEDIGRGSPYSRGGHAFAEFARELGFDGLQLGPQGQTSPGNVSPYDGSVFSKSNLSLALAELAEPRYARLLPASYVEAAANAAPAGNARAHDTYAFRTSAHAVATAAATLERRVAEGDNEATELEARIAAFARHAGWLAHDARFEAFTAVHGTDDWRSWPEHDRAPSAARIAEVEHEKRHVLAGYALAQYVLAQQHQDFRAHLGSLGVRLYGDMQIGVSLRDRWSRGHFFLDRYCLGAPPSRTNVEGQPWGYAVLDPRQYQRRFVGNEETAPVRFMRERVTKLFAELDGLRIDHPHGLVCPWVYDGEALDPHEAVVHGARLFETPSSARHPSLADLAIVRTDQIDPTVPDYDDHRVAGLSEEQITEYERLFEIVMEGARNAGRTADDVMCEVLSTCPTPLACVTQRYGLGRFRVTQKASLVDPADGYRGENARPRDWIMLGNHDTEPLLTVLDRWTQAGTLPARAAYLATRLEPEPSKREAFAAGLLGDTRRLVTAMFAELFVGPASNVLVFWADLFGERARYNTPGVFSPLNWTMRVPTAFRETYAERRALGAAMDVTGALAMAMRARGADFIRAHAGLISALEASAA